MPVTRVPRALLLTAACLLAASPALAAPDRGDPRPAAERTPTLTEVVTDVVLSFWERVRNRLDGLPPSKTDRTPGAGIDPDGWRPRGS